MIFEHINEIL
jgi:hypothetical protein